MKLNKIHHEQCDKRCKYRYNMTVGTHNCLKCKFSHGRSLLDDAIYCAYPRTVKDTECERILFFYIKKKGVISKTSCPHKRNGSKCVTACYTCEYAKKIGKKMFYHEFSAYCKLFNKNNVLCAYKALHRKDVA